jgi:prepilin-type N-terminal cleavage/methylation domain-containing protein
MKAREDGFSLIELLVVVLILGGLAALAFPSFINQKGKASDAKAKNNIQVAQRAMETYYLDHDTYATANMNGGSDPDSLITLEETLKETPTPSIDAQTQSSYTLRVISGPEAPVTFTLRHRSNGQVERTCTPASTGGCSSAGDW